MCERRFWKQETTGYGACWQKTRTARTDSLLVLCETLKRENLLLRADNPIKTVQKSDAPDEGTRAQPSFGRCRCVYGPTDTDRM